MPHLFSYGTLQQESVQLESFGRALKGKPDVLPGWRREMVEIIDAEVFCLSGERFHPILVPGEERYRRNSRHGVRRSASMRTSSAPMPTKLRTTNASPRG